MLLNHLKCTKVTLNKVTDESSETRLLNTTVRSVVSLKPFSPMPNSTSKHRVQLNSQSLLVVVQIARNSYAYWMIIIIM